MSGSLGAVIYGELRAVATQVATAIANIAAVKADIATARGEATANRDSINGNTNAARDNINAVTNAARDNVKAHVSAAVAGVGGIRNVQHAVGTNANWTNGDEGTGTARYLDVPISAVNPAKTFIIPIRTVWMGGAGPVPMSYRLINASTVRCLAYSNGNNPGAYGFCVVEGV
ncbi:hypothetical protein [Comamonas koreensis]|uniref:Phage tail protein n=1 Tax=Comamonas koreensis TaxID=160825 RepID=A0AAW4XZN2_9BURK|nr:hypothetical protein [Comamonas koreensis]MCD2166826.1 hypothetical protein [Comamonas koreensis]